MIRWLSNRVDNLLSRSVDWLSNERQPAVEPKVRWRETPASEPAIATPTARATPEATLKATLKATPKATPKATLKATLKATASEAEAQLPTGWLESADPALDEPASGASSTAAPAVPALSRTAVNPDAPAATKILDTAVNDDVEMADVEMADATEIGILEYLHQASDASAAMIDLVRHTGKSRSTLRTRLEALAKAGRIERVGAGLKTRYRLLDASI